jgi:glucosylceramidase
VRLGSSVPGKLHNVAFRTPAGKMVLIVVNSGQSEQHFQLADGENYAGASLKPGEVATYVW